MSKPTLCSRTLLAASLLLLSALFGRPAVAQVAVYHGVSATTHQNQWTTLSNQGYRPISLSVAGGMAQQRYTAVWVRRIGARYAGAHGMTRSQYRSWRTTTIAAGYRPYLVTASGEGADEVLAAVYVADRVAAVDEIDAYSSGLDNRIAWARANGYVPTCIAEYGSATLPRYCAVFVPDTSGVLWAVSRRQTATDYQADFDAQIEGHARPAFVDVSDRQRYTTIWRDDSIGNFAAMHGLTATQFQTEVNNRPNQYPVFADAGGSGSNSRWAVVFAQRDAPHTRSLTKTGTAAAALQPFDDYMTSLVQSTGARAASIAIAKDGRLVYARGYTNAEPGYPITQPTSMFRLASCSKPIAALAAHILDESGALTMSTRVGTALGLSGSDPRFGDIRVSHTIQHSSGVPRDISSWTVANWLRPSNPLLPVSAWDTARYAATRTLAFAPGTVDAYSNIGYTLLGEVIEARSGKSFERFVREDLASPLGVTRIHVGGSRRSQLRSGEVFYHHDSLGLAASDLHTDRRPLSAMYGGGSYGNLLRIDAPGGLITSTVDFVRILTGCFDLAPDGVLLQPSTANSILAQPTAPLSVDRGGFAWSDLGNGVISHGKSGTLWGASTQVVYRSDGVSIAVFVNRSGAHASRGALNSRADAVTTWPTTDLFPSYGLPAYVRTAPRVHAISPTVLANVGDAPFVVTGEVLSTVDRIGFGRLSIRNRSNSNPAEGWFRIVNDQRIEVYPPQGLDPASYALRLWNGLTASSSTSVSLSIPRDRLLSAPTSTRAPFTLVASRGPSASGSVALMAYSTSSRPSALPGIVSLDLGAGFSQLSTWPAAIPFETSSRCARWQVPHIPGLTLHFQAVIIDPRARHEPPFPVTPMRSVRM